MPQVGDVIELPFAHGLLDWEGRRRVAGELRGRYDSAYVLPNTIKSALIPFLARIPRRVGYHGEGRFGLLNERLPNPEGRPPMVAFYAAPRTLDDVVNHVVGKVLDVLRIEHDLFPRWTGHLDRRK